MLAMSRSPKGALFLCMHPERESANVPIVSCQASPIGAISGSSNQMSLTGTDSRLVLLESSSALSPCGTSKLELQAGT